MAGVAEDKVIIDVGKVFIDVGEVSKSQRHEDVDLLLDRDALQVVFEVPCRWCGRIIRGVSMHRRPPLLYLTEDQLKIRALRDAHTAFIMHLDDMHAPEIIRTKAAC
jgi:hypothetical protein